MAQSPDRPEGRSTATLAERRVRPPSGARLDLASALNRYGPPEAVLRALRSLSPADVRLHPADAAARLEDRYAELLGVPPAELVAGPGPAELVEALALRVPRRAVAVPLPAPPAVLASLPGRGFSRYPGEQVPTLEQLDEALVAELVVTSNPHALTGTALDPRELAALAAAHPTSTLVVDETFVDFTADPARSSLVGTEADNVVVLRSVDEFSGMGSTRTGVAWCRDRRMLKALFGAHTSPVSGLDLVAAEAALSSRAWAGAARRQLAEDALWLAAALAPLGGRVVAEGVGVHFRCLFTDRAPELAAGLARQGVGVLLLGPSVGVHPGAVRVAAPRKGERAALSSALDALASPVALGVAG